MESDDTQLQVEFDDTIAANAATAQAPPVGEADSERQIQIERNLALESENALAHEERQRTLRVAPVMGIFGVLGLSILPVFDGTLWAKRLLQGCLVPAILCMFWLWWRASRGKSVDGWLAEVPWLAGFLSTCAATVYFGVYSPAIAIMILAIVLYAMGRARWSALGLCVLAAATTLGIASLEFAGVMADPGLVTASHLPSRVRVAGLAMIQTLLFTGYFVGRLARRATVDSITEMQNARRELARREVIAQEAQEKVRRVLNIGGEGRHTAATFGSYQLAELIGQGGMGEVYRAAHVETGDIAAVKVIHSHLVRDDEFLERFLREAKLSSSVNSPYIVSVRETGQTSHGPYIAMELLSGTDLSEHLSSAAKGTMSIEHMQCLADQVGAGLDAAAAAGIVHRDIKPQNIFLADDRNAGSAPLQCKILDFGIARAISGEATITKNSVTVGTPAYMAPEQARGGTADHRTDLHALTALLYRAGTGLPPFTGDNAVSIMLRVVQDMPRPVSELGLPAGLNAFFAKGFAKNPDDRFQSGAELSSAFAACCQSSP